MSTNVTTNHGRHGVGAPTGDPGTIRGGQEAPAGNSPKTGVPAGAPIRSMAPRPSIPANQAETSKDLEARLLAAPQPFTYEGGAATLEVGTVNWQRAGVPYDIQTSPSSGPQVRGGGTAPMSNQQIEAAAAVDGMPSAKGMNPINGGRASWMRKD